ncbi:MAG: pyruvate synthase subunit beta, partial [Deltaproteobacteria bacterium]|nr:pyruvate synthase subunit beta [Deltaproteobacteria bacterium]
PPGWGYPTADTVKIGRLAVETGLFILFEIEDGRFRFTGRSKTMAERGKLIPLVHYVERQGRFKKMSIEQLSTLQASVNSRWEECLKRAEG